MAPHPRFQALPISASRTPPSPPSPLLRSRPLHRALLLVTELPPLRDSATPVPLAVAVARCHLHTPSCMRDSARVASERWGAQGRAHTQWGKGTEGKRCPLHLRVVRGPIEVHGVGEKGEGGGNRTQSICVVPLHAKGGWGACNAAPILTAPPILPCCTTLPVHARMWAPPSLHPIHAAGRGRVSAHTKQEPHFRGAPALCVPQLQVRVGGTRKSLPCGRHGSHSLTLLPQAPQFGCSVHMSGSGRGWGAMQHMDPVMYALLGHKWGWGERDGVGWRGIPHALSWVM